MTIVVHSAERGLTAVHGVILLCLLINVALPQTVVDSFVLPLLDVVAYICAYNITKTNTTMTGFLLGV